MGSRFWDFFWQPATSDPQLLKEYWDGVNKSKQVSVPKHETHQHLHIHVHADEDKMKSVRKFLKEKGVDYVDVDAKEV
tara:strand:+ start:1525 stop:1758 length:234 start_codon:yes stop_codon:yes gene_type:complete